jgi:hypothetical protein
VLVGEVERVGGEGASLLALDQEGVVVACVVILALVSAHSMSHSLRNFISPSWMALDSIGANVRVTAQIRSELRGFCATDMVAVWNVRR